MAESREQSAFDKLIDGVAAKNPAGLSGNWVAAVKFGYDAGLEAAAQLLADEAKHSAYAAELMAAIRAIKGKAKEGQ